MHFSTKRQRFLVNQGYSFKVNHTSVCIHEIFGFIFVQEVHIPREFVGSVHMYCGVYMYLEMHSPHFCLFCRLWQRLLEWKMWDYYAISVLKCGWPCALLGSSVHTCPASCSLGKGSWPILALLAQNRMLSTCGYIVVSQCCFNWGSTCIVWVLCMVRRCTYTCSQFTHPSLALYPGVHSEGRRNGGKNAWF